VANYYYYYSWAVCVTQTHVARTARWKNGQVEKCVFVLCENKNTPARPTEQSAALSDRNAEVLAVTAARCNNNA
jgi:hypothetical protein